MFPLTDRCARLRQEAVNTKTRNQYAAFPFYILSNRALRACSPEEPNGILRARSVLYVTETIRPYIEDGELIVGYNFGDCSEPRNICGEWFLIDDPDEERRLMRQNGFTDEEIDYYRKDLDAWNHLHREADLGLTDYEVKMHEEWIAFCRPVVSDHGVLNYQSILELGFDGLRKKVEDFETENGPSALYTAAKLFCDAGCTLGERYAQKAEALSKDATLSPARRKELEKIRDVCRRVPKHPAATLQEAIQSLWFGHILTCWEDRSINANSLGRLDQILYPYYRHDIDSGILTKEQAFELICCLWLKLYRDYDVQQSCVGGCKKDGTCAVNELSYMMLDATEALDFIRCMSVRFSHDTPPEFMKRALEVVGHLQKGVPFFFNDDVMIPALVSKGISPEDARGYTQIGCVETTIPGKANSHAVCGEISVLKALEFALNGGKSMISDLTAEGITPVPPEEIGDYETLEREVSRYVAHFLRVACTAAAKIFPVYADVQQRPYKSLLTEGCLETNTDFNHRGAKYDFYQIMIGGLPNLADSLAALRKLVFNEKKYTLVQIIEQLKNNFSDERIRQDLLNNAPKFGNDIDEVDSIAVRFTDFCCDKLDELSEELGYSFHAQPFTYLWMIEHGQTSAASADGRRKGEPIAYSVSPMQGRDYVGLTAVLNTLTKFPTKRTPGTTSAIVEVDPKLFCDRNMDLLTGMMLALAEKGLSNVQFNITDAETLIDAKKHPEKHRNLAVRVSGFSQKFYLLDEKLQDHIIERTKHTCV